MGQSLRGRDIVDEMRGSRGVALTSTFLASNSKYAIVLGALDFIHSVGPVRCRCELWEKQQ